MGGYGSGGHNIKKGSTGYYPRIDSFWFNKILPIMYEKEIKETNREISWNNGAKINIITFKDKIITDYRYQLNNYDEWQNVKDNIYFSQLTNNYGGNRLYFICPNCNNRFRFLYVRNGYFRCRHCNKLNYPSSRKGKDDIPSNKMETIFRKKFKVDTKELSYIDMADFIPDKPKGMHWNTYYKWLDELEKAQDEYDRMVLRKCYSFGIKHL